MVDTVGCNLAGWEVSGLVQDRRQPPHRSKWEAEVAQQQCNREEGARSVGINRKDKGKLINSVRS